EQLAMIAQQIAEALTNLERVEEAQLHARLDHAPPVGTRQAERAERIEHHADAGAALHGCAERRDETRDDVPGVHQVHLQQHRLAPRLDRREQGGKELGPPIEQLEGVPRSPRPPRRCKLLRIPACHRLTMTDLRTTCHPAVMLLLALLAPAAASAA